MTKRYRSQNKSDVLAAPGHTSQLPTNRPIAVYYRQSTDAQIGNVSTTIQTVDMVEYLKQRGWAEDDITMIDMDGGISGSTKIDERPGMSMLFDLITEGKVGAVACQDEDRLFRDVTQIQVNIFIEACRESRVLVLTPSMVYDFANELTGTFHARQFRFKSEMAAEYINAVIRGRLHRAKHRLMIEGRWAGGGMPAGFMVDMRKTLPDGSANPNWRHYVPFEPYAEVILEYYRLFLSYAGNLRATVRHIHAHGPYYPDPETCRPPEGFKVFYPNTRRYGNGYCPGRTGLANLLTNAAYIGHWIVNGTVVKWDNHPAIVPVDVFLRAFNYLSDVRPDGSPNRSYRPYQPQARPSVDEKRAVERPLCAGLIVSQYEDEWRGVGTSWVSSLEHYTYVLCASDAQSTYIWGKAADFVDGAVVGLLLSKLRATFDAEAWHKVLAGFSKEYEKERQRTASQLKVLEQVMDNLITSLENLTNPNMLARVQERYEAAQAEHDRLQAELLAANNEAARFEALAALRESCGPALDNWDELTRDTKVSILQAFIARIEAAPVEKNGLHLVVKWRDGSSDETVLPRQSSIGCQWLPSQVKRLLELIDAGAPQVEIASAFPQRTWAQIRNKVYSERRSGVAIATPKLIKDDETYEMYLARTQNGALHHQASTGERWSPEEEKELLRLLDQGATQVEIAEALPHRTWESIRMRIRKLRGKNVSIPGTGEVKKHETIFDYRQRRALETKDGTGENSLESLTSETLSGRAPPGAQG